MYGQRRIRQQKVNVSVFDTGNIALAITGVVFLCLATLATPAIQAAVITTPAPLGTIATDGEDYDATITIGLTIDDSNTFYSSIAPGTDAVITATIQPDPAHTGQQADIYIVQRIGGDFTMKNPDGQFVSWNVKASTLIPALESVVLGANQDVEVYAGLFNTEGTQRVYVGYMPSGTNTLIFNPTAAKFEITEPEQDALTFFEENIADQIVGAKCVVCHVENGVADGQTDLIYSSDPDDTQQNFDTLSALFFSRPDGLEYILNKASGGEGHVGGNQLPQGSSDYLLLEQFLTLLGGGSSTPPVTSDVESFFQPLVMQDRQQTLRQAAILFAGRLPTDSEKSGVTLGGDNVLRETIRDLMTGENFHEFIKDAANDRLLVRGVLEFNILNACQICFPAFAENLFQLEVAALESGSRLGEFQYQRLVGEGVIESPLELIAYVVENDFPYSEILTADYALFNPALNEAVGGTAVFNDEDNPVEFAPGIMEGYYRIDDSVEFERVEDIMVPKIIDPGDLQTDYPHAGVLNTNAFLHRYPSTATNRNRARARWTFYHFLGVDIEASAQRTTDPEALADTNNPTMNNSNCTVCHQIMDPVAGTFQNYGDDGFYRSNRGGMDSLDPFYKFPEEGESLYEIGDTWYRDMREPGLDGDLAPDADNSLQWLAQEIVADTRFATSAVRFWWPAVISQELVALPEVETDVDYQDRLLAFDAQQATINALAESFTANGMNVKDLLVELVMSEWFRAESYEESGQELPAHSIAGLGDEKLLTPEQLSRKTRAITGFNWNSWIDPLLNKTYSGLDEQFGLFYGGIDSLNIQDRSREMTPLMSTVAMAHGLQSSCPIVLREFILDDDERLLFSDISEFVTPLSEGNQLISIESDDNQDVETYSLSLSLQAGAKTISASFINDACDWDPESQTCAIERNVYITGLNVIGPNNVQTVIGGEEATLPPTDCGATNTNFTSLWGNCKADYAFTANQSGQYTVEISVTADQGGEELAMINLSVDANIDPLTSGTNGADTIREKLVELHDKMLGQDVSINSPEIDASYELFVESWLERQTAGYDSLFNEAEMCNWGADIEYAYGLGFPGELLVEVEDEFGTSYELNWDELWPFLNGFASDPLYTKQSWKSVITYLLTHYDYLYE